MNRGPLSIMKAEKIQLVELITGALVILAAATFLYYALGFSGGGSIVGGAYPVKASFRSVEGINVGSDVKIGGVTVGYVDSVQLNAQTFAADLVFMMRNDIKLSDDSIVIIASEGLLGESYVEIQPGGSAYIIEPNGSIENTQSSISLLSLLLGYLNSQGRSSD